MYFLVNTLSVVATDVTLTLTSLGTPMTDESAVRVAPRIVPTDCVVPPGLTLIELGSSTTDTREMADVGGPAEPTSVAELQLVVAAEHTIAPAALATRIARMRLYALGVATLFDLPCRSTLRPW